MLLRDLVDVSNTVAAARGRLDKIGTLAQLIARLNPDEIPIAVAYLTGALRQGRMASYDIAVGLPLGVDPDPYARAGATWWLPELEPGVRLDTVRGVLRDGPAA